MTVLLDRAPGKYPPPVPPAIRPLTPHARFEAEVNAGPIVDNATVPDVIGHYGLQWDVDDCPRCGGRKHVDEDCGNCDGAPEVPAARVVTVPPKEQYL